MPIHEYRCNSCEALFEKREVAYDPLHRPECPECGSGLTVRAVSASTFQLKGGGWFKEGYGGSK